MKIFTGNSNPLLADSIAKSLNQDIGKIEIKKFSDGELYVAFNENIRNEEVFIIQSTNPPSDNILELLLMLDAARRASAKKVIAVTGTNGKSTTVSLIHKIIFEQNINVFLGGNIKPSLFSCLDSARYNKYVVELSSFQLELAPSFQAHISIQTLLSL